MAHTRPVRTACAVALLCRAPIPGFAKTRLIPHLGEMQTARLQEELILQAVTTALDAEVGPVELWCDPDESHPFFGKLIKKYPIRLAMQPRGDRGTRLHTCAAGALTEADGVILMGVDCAMLQAYHLQEAADALARGNDVALAPADDGTYVLLALKHASARLFDGIPWGTSQVLAETQARIAQLGWRCHLLETLWNVNTPDEHHRWRLIVEAHPELRRRQQF